MKKAKTEKQRGMMQFFSDPGHVLLIMYVACILFFIVFGGVSQLWAEEVREKGTTLGINDIQRGELLIPTKEEGRYVPAPLLDLKAEIVVNGITARTTVQQRFENGSSEWVEAIYAFPLPGDSAVDTLRMIVGERIIVGEIKEKKEAKRVYEQAKREGRKTSLLVQRRPNIFTTAVANIAPGETILVEIEYQQVVHYTDNIFSLRFPMVIAPRYIPGTPLDISKETTMSFDGGGWASNTDLVPDASSITPHVVSQEKEKVHPIELSVKLAPGFPVKRAESLYHGVDSKKDGSELSFRFNHEVKADRDFVLEWEPEKGQGITGALFSEVKKGKHYKLLMVMPPFELEQQERVPREMIFVLDTSGSMAGESIEQAKKALILAISRLAEEDYFNVIEFNDKAHALFSSARKADLKNINDALAFVTGLDANGGTEIASALGLALGKEKGKDRLRQVVFLTDGAVGNEEQLFKIIHEKLGKSRLFTVGIGSAPNAYFMTRAASMGRGTHTYIGKVTEVEEKMVLLFKKLESPVVTGIQLEVPERDDLEFYPAPLPDLYAGEPLIVSIKTSSPLEKLSLAGSRQGKAWKMEIDTGKGNDKVGVATLWARKKIGNEMESLNLGGDRESTRNAILTTALEHHLVSKYTSLVAVEKVVSRPLDKDLVLKHQKVNLAHGMEHGAIFGGGAKTASPARIHLGLGMIVFLLSLLIFHLRRQLCRKSH